LTAVEITTSQPVKFVSRNNLAQRFLVFGARDIVFLCTVVVVGKGGFLARNHVKECLPNDAPSLAIQIPIPESNMDAGLKSLCQLERAKL
jgi:hypothetical protein